MTTPLRKPASIPAKLSERQVTEQCIDWLEAHHWTCIRLQSGLLRTPDGRHIRTGKKGLPDWICIRGQKYFLMEVKRKGLRLGPDQVLWLTISPFPPVFRLVDDLQGLIEWHRDYFC